MISKYNHKDFCWIDLKSPKKEELLHVLDEYNISSIDKEKIIRNFLKNEININDEYIHIDINNKIKSFINEKILLTIRNDELDGVNRLSREIELDISKDNKITNNKLLFIHLLKNLYLSSEDELYEKEEQINKFKKLINLKDKKIKNLTWFSIIITILLIIFIWL